MRNKMIKDLLEEASAVAMFEIGSSRFTDSDRYGYFRNSIDFVFNARKQSRFEVDLLKCQETAIEGNKKVGTVFLSPDGLGFYITVKSFRNPTVRTPALYLPLDSFTFKNSTKS